MIVIGAEQVESPIAADLDETHEVVVIDYDPERVDELNYSLDVLALHDNETSVDMFEEAGVGRTDMTIASTDDDETNIVACAAVRTISNTFAITRVKNTEYLRTWQRSKKAFGIDFMVCTNLLVTESIIRVVSPPVACGVDPFTGRQVQMAEFEVNEENPVANQTVSEVDRLDPLTFAAIPHDGEITIPRGNPVIGSGDRVVVTGSPRSIQGFVNSVPPDEPPGTAEKIVIVDGDEIGYRAARPLEERGFRPRLIEHGIERARELAGVLPGTIVMESDATGVDFPGREYTGDADLLISTFDFDEKNLFVSLLIARLDIERTVAVIDTAPYVDLSETVGVNMGIGPRGAIAEGITRSTREGGAENIALIGLDKAEVLEIEVGAENVLAGKPIRESAATLPEGVVIGVIIRRRELITPRGNTVIGPGNHVVVFVNSCVIDDVTPNLQVDPPYNPRSVLKTRPCYTVAPSITNPSAEEPGTRYVSPWIELRVDYRTSLRFVGTILKYLVIPLCFPLVIALYHGESVLPLVVTMTVTVFISTGLERLADDPDIGAREGFLMVALTWLAVTIVGVIPLLIEACGIPFVASPIHPESTLGDPVSALFEAMSGSTATRAMVFDDISFDPHTRGIMMWRQLTQWLGETGIIILAVVILLEFSVGGAQLMDAEAPGPGIEELAPHVVETAHTPWDAYLSLTTLEIAFLYGLSVTSHAQNIGVCNAITHGPTTTPTDEFSPEVRSIKASSVAVQWVIIPFMVAAGTNFVLSWHVLAGDPKRLFHDAEFKSYLNVIGVVPVIFTGIPFLGDGLMSVAPAGEAYDQLYLENIRTAITNDVEPAVHQSMFQIVSIATTTGYASIDFSAWSVPAWYVLLLAMFIGGSGGSTSSVTEIVRWYVIMKSPRRELFATAHPEAVHPVRLADRAVDERTTRGIYTFTPPYPMLFFVSTDLLHLDATRIGFDMSILETISTIAATLGNVDPGFGVISPVGSYLDFSNSSKLYMVLLIWVSRLEILPVLVIFMPEYWWR